MTVDIVYEFSRLKIFIDLMSSRKKNSTRKGLRSNRWKIEGLRMKIYANFVFHIYR